MYLESSLRAIRTDAVVAAVSHLATRAPDLGVYPTSSLQKVAIFINFFFPSLALLIVSLRVYCRIRQRNFGWDDAIIIAAAVISMIEMGFCYIVIRIFGTGIHIEDLRMPTFDEAIYGGISRYFDLLLYNPILALVKASVLLFLLRLCGQNRPIRIWIHATNALNIGELVSVFIVCALQCLPVAYFWDYTVDGRCINQAAFYISGAAITVFTDLLVLGIPIWIVKDLQMRFRVKVMLLMIFMLGTIVTIIGCLRIAFFYQVYYQPQTMADPTYDIRSTYSILENSVAIIAACGPALHSLLRMWFPNVFRAIATGSKKTPSRSAPYPPTIGGGAGSFTTKGTKGLSRSEVHGRSRTSSEEKFMTYGGILQTREVQVQSIRGNGSDRPWEAEDEMYMSDYRQG